MNPAPQVMIGETGMVKLGLNVTMMVLAVVRAPAAELVKPTVQVEVAFATVEPGVKVTAEGAPINTGETTLAGVTSWEVDTLKPG